MRRTSPIDPIIRARGVVVLDGGLATELERRGHDLDHPLWSARLLQSKPEAIRDVHLSYLEAGADCLITSSYQASIPGLMAEECGELLKAFFRQIRLEDHSSLN